jgi:hypothetical protein
MGITRKYVYNGSVKKQDDDDDKDQENKTYYKILNPDWKCRGYQYRLGGTYSIPEKDLVLGDWGFHCCEHAVDCLAFYDLNPLNHYVEVKMLGKIITSSPYDKQSKCATNVMKIEREIPYEEWLELCTVTMIAFVDNRKYLEEIYVKGIVEKSLEYFDDVSEQEEDLVEHCHTRIPDRVPFRYNTEEYRRDKTLKRTSNWIEKTENARIVDYDYNGIPETEFIYYGTGTESKPLQ